MKKIQKNRKGLVFGIFMALLITFVGLGVFPKQVSAATNEGWLWPAPNCYRVQSNFGFRTINGKKGTHAGIDISGSNLNAVVASKSGTIVESVSKYKDNTHTCPAAGNYVVIKHTDGTYSMYAHMKPGCISSGKYVEQGQTIGYAGNTGNSSGKHLHFQIFTNNSSANTRNSTALNPMPTNANITIVNYYQLPSGWSKNKISYQFATAKEKSSLGNERQRFGCSSMTLPWNIKQGTPIDLYGRIYTNKGFITKMHVYIETAICPSSRKCEAWIYPNCDMSDIHYNGVNAKMTFKKLPGNTTYHYVVEVWGNEGAYSKVVDKYFYVSK